MPSIIINTGDQPVALVPKEEPKAGKDCCCDDTNKLADQDFFGLIQKISPNLYKVLAEKAFMLDMCALDRKRMDANTCPIDCRPRAWDDLSCCDRITGEARALSTGYGTGYGTGVGTGVGGTGGGTGVGGTGGGTRGIGGLGGTGLSGTGTGGRRISSSAKD